MSAGADAKTRTVHNIIALSTLPASWLGADPHHIAHSLAATLFDAVDPAFALVAIQLPDATEPIVRAHLNGRSDTSPAVEAVAAKIREWARTQDREALLTLRSVFSFGLVRVAARPIGPDASFGVVAAGFAVESAPSFDQHLLLDIAAAQAFTAVQNAGLLDSLDRTMAERDRTAAELREQLAVSTAIANTSIDAIILSNHEGNIIDFNPAAEAIFGYRRDEVVGKQMAELIIPERLRARHRAGIAHFVATGEAPAMGRRLEMPALRADGTEFMCELVIAHIPDTQPPVFTGFIRDITHRLERERALGFFSDLNRATQPLVDPSQITWAAANLLGRYLEVNRCAYAQVMPDEDEFVISGDYTSDTFSMIGRFKMSDFGPEALRLLRANEVLVIDDVANDVRAVDHRAAYRAAEIGAIVSVPLHKAGRFVAGMAVHQKGPRHWTAADIELVRDAVNRCWESLERARVLQSLQESEERHRLIVENVKDFAIFSADLSGRVTHWNPGAQEVFGWTEDEMLGETMDRIYTPEDRAANVAARELRSAAENGCAPDDRWHMRKDGRRIFVTGAARPILDRKDQVIGINKVARDITERKRVEDELREAREHLEKTVQERTARLRETVGELEAYSYSIAHDMRAPLRAMQGFSQILLEEYGPRLDDDGREYLRRIVNASNRLDRLIQDILTYSKVTRDDLTCEPVDLNRLVVEMIKHYPSFQPPHADIEVDHPLAPVLGHEPSLNQCVSNLVANAVKFVPPGRHPWVRLRTEPRGDRVRLWVEDNGIGIDEENQKRIFEIFVRVNPDKAYPGTGIGLSIVRKAIERMGGKVGVKSRIGEGSRFWIDLPPAPAAPPS